MKGKERKGKERKGKERAKSSKKGCGVFSRENFMTNANNP
jgi:hypothetical protein